LDDDSTNTFDPFKRIFDLEHLKIQYDAAGILGFSSHFKMVQNGKIARSHLSTIEAILMANHIPWFSKDLFIEGCHDL